MTAALRRLGKEWSTQMELTVNVVKELIDSLNQSGVDILRLETDGFKLTLERNPHTVQMAAPVAAPEQTPCAVPANSAAAPVSAPQEKGNLVKAPIVGTFYTSAGPDKPPFAVVGQKVKKGDILFIIESMKLMNEIASEFDGTVAEILVENGKPVEFGQPILRIE